MPVYKKVNKDFFKTWTPEMAYVLGFFFADGSHDVNPRGSEYFSFQITDKELLFSIRKALLSNHTIAHRLPRSANDSSQYRLQIGSKVMCHDLRTHGVCAGKSHTMFLPQIPEGYVSDFVRGYFDGDGNVWSGLVHKKRNTQHSVLQVGFTSCSRKFLDGLFLQLKALGLIGGGVYCKNRAFCIKYSTSDSLRLYQLMYGKLSDSELYLQRKKQVFEAYIKQNK